MEKLLEYIVREPIQATEQTPLLLMLHGYGSNENDLFSFASELPDELLIVSARAPLSLGLDSFAWYSLQMNAQNQLVSNIPEALEARNMILNLIDFLQRIYHFKPEKSFLLGFSQGSILSYSIALNYPEKIQNIIALSGYINEEITPNQPNIHYKKLNFFCSHGTEDSVIPIAAARKTASLLTQLDIRHVYKEYHSGHGVSPANFTDFKNWITSIL